MSIYEEALKKGCGDHGCYFVKPEGMGTNGGCRCLPTRSTILWIKKSFEVICKKDSEIERLKSELAAKDAELESVKRERNILMADNEWQIERNEGNILMQDEMLEAVTRQRDEAVEVLKMVEDNTKMPHQHSDYYERLCCLSERAREFLAKLASGEKEGA